MMRLRQAVHCDENRTCVLGRFSGGAVQEQRMSCTWSVHLENPRSCEPREQQQRTCVMYITRGLVYYCSA